MTVLLTFHTAPIDCLWNKELELGIFLKKSSFIIFQFISSARPAIKCNFYASQNLAVLLFLLLFFQKKLFGQNWGLEDRHGWTNDEQAQAADIDRIEANQQQEVILLARTRETSDHSPPKQNKNEKKHALICLFSVLPSRAKGNKN